MRTLVLCLLLAPGLIHAADITGDWIAETHAIGTDPQFARVRIQFVGVMTSGPNSLTLFQGTWNQMALEGSVSPERLSLSLKLNGQAAGTLTAKAVKDMYAGEGMLSVRGSLQHVTWTLTRPAQRQGAAKNIDFMNPPIFHGYYSAANPPVLHVFPGDTVRTRTYDAARDIDKRTPGGDLETGPFYIEGALPGDTLVVKLNRLRVNRDSARQGSRINTRAITPAYAAAAQYDTEFDGEWKLDREKSTASLAHPTPHMKNLVVPIQAMLGCISVAPVGEEAYRGTDLGAYGGNMDYNQMGEGVTLYLPVFHPGALLTFGDAHAAMGDGELTGAALETSADIDFTVEVIKDYASAGPRLENADYIMTMGITGSLADSLQLATEQMIQWLKKDYGLSDSEMAIFLGAVLKYDVTELVDPHLNVVARIPKSALRAFQ